MDWSVHIQKTIDLWGWNNKIFTFVTSSNNPIVIFVTSSNNPIVTFVTSSNNPIVTIVTSSNSKWHHNGQPLYDIRIEQWPVCRPTYNGDRFLNEHGRYTKTIIDWFIRALVQTIWPLGVRLATIALGLAPSGNSSQPHSLGPIVCTSALIPSQYLYTNAFFTFLSLPESFLQTQPETWKENEEFKRAEKIVHSLKVVNDTAERGVKLIQDFNAILTKSEEQKQFLLQVVKHHRESYPDSSKTTVVKGLASSPSELANWMEIAVL